MSGMLYALKKIVISDERRSNWDGLDPKAKRLLDQIAEQFRQIDKWLLAILKDPETNTVGARGNDDKKKMEPIWQKAPEEHRQLQTYIERPGFENPWDYLSDHSVLDPWRAAFQLTTACLSVYRETTHTCFEIRASVRSLAPLIQEAASFRNVFPHIHQGVRLRCEALDAWAKALSRFWDEKDINKERDYPVLCSLLQKQETPREVPLPSFVSSKSVLGTTALATLLAASLQVASFLQSPPYDRRDFSTCQILNLFQSATIQVLGLFVLLAPLIHHEFAREPWIASFAAVSGIASLLGPALYPALGEGWSNLLLCGGGIFQALCVLFIGRGVERRIRKGGKQA